MKSRYYVSAVALMAALIAGTWLTAQDKPQPAERGAPAGKAFRAKEIIGSKVSLQENAPAGTVEDIVLDEFGNADYLIVATAQKQLVTVPWDAVELSLEKRTAMVHITPEQFKTVPTYTVQQYPMFTAPTYRSEIYRYYGLTPGEQRRAFRRAVRD
jgi:hypothetical protein